MHTNFYYLLIFYIKKIYSFFTFHTYNKSEIQLSIRCVKTIVTHCLLPGIVRFLGLTYTQNSLNVIRI